MPRRAKAKGLYQRGPFWLDYDRKGDGSPRTPNLLVWWYDRDRGRNRSLTTGTGDVVTAKAALDRIYLERTEGQSICPTCGQRRHGAGGFLVTQAIADHLSITAERPSAQAIRARLSHVVAFIAQAGDALLTCERVDEGWIARFRRWAAEQPIIAPSGVQRPRTASTIENSVLQLAAAINSAHARGDAAKPAQFRALQPREVNRSPRHRATIDDLAAMFRYCVAPARAKSDVHRARLVRDRGALHRFLIISVASWCRPDAAHDVSTKPERGQWHSARRVLDLNPKGRRQTRKYRATVRVPYQVAPWLDDTDGFFVPVGSVRAAWRGMADEVGLPGEGEAGMKLIRRSMAQLARERGVPKDQRDLQMGHAQVGSIGDTYAPFDPDYLPAALAFTETVVDEIESRVPGAFHRDNTASGPVVVPIIAARKA